MIFQLILVNSTITTRRDSGLALESRLVATLENKLFRTELMQMLHVSVAWITDK